LCATSERRHALYAPEDDKLMLVHIVVQATV
jgi:hypothetical protein